MSTSADSFAAFVAARSPALHRTAFLLTGNFHDAEDLVQVALFKSARRWRLIRGEHEPYVRKVLYREAISRWRWSAARVPERLTDAVPETTAHAAPDSETRLALADALARLTIGQRTVLVLRFYEDLSESQTAEVMGVRLGTVKSQTRHALMRLRALSPELADLAGEPEAVARGPLP